MNSEPPTGDELASMLVTMKQNVLERTTESPRRKRNRNLGLGLGLAALLAIGGGSGALALGMLPSPFQAAAPATPTNTPTPTPTVTPTATPRPTPTVAPVLAPVPSVPIDCATLASGVRMDLFIPSPEQGAPDLLVPYEAAVLEQGALTCSWVSAEQPYSNVRISVSSDRATGLATVDALRGSGAAPVGTNESSASFCTESGCDAAFVTDAWWLTFVSSDVDAQADEVTPATRAANTAAALSSVAARLEGVSAAPPWDRPESSWSRVRDCTTLQPGVPMGRLVGTPSLEGPTQPDYQDAFGLVRAEDRPLECVWEKPYVEGAPASELDGLTVTLSPGSGWAVDAVDSESYLERKPATVSGADRAEFVCVHHEGSGCFLNVWTDGSWLQLATGNTYEDSLQGRLVAAAEAIVATRPAS
jgi:hypothetical protein